MAPATVALTERSCTPRFVATVAMPAVMHDASAASSDLGRRRAVVLRREDLGVIGFDRERLSVRVVLAEAGEVGDRRAAVGAVHPLAAGSPLELRGLGGVGERLAGAADRFDVHAVVDGWGVGLSHCRVLLSIDGGPADTVAAAVTTVARRRLRVMESGWRCATPCDLQDSPAGPGG